MTVKELSKQLKRTSSKLEMIMVLFIILIFYTVSTFYTLPIYSNITLKYIVAITVISIVWVAYVHFLNLLNGLSLARQIKKRTKHIVCDDIYFCYKKKSRTMNHNFFLIIRNNTITELPYEYYQIEKESDLTMQMLDGQDRLNRHGKECCLIHIK